MFSKLFRKMTHMTCYRDPKLAQRHCNLPFSIHITDYVSLCGSYAAFFGIVYWTKVVQRVRIYHLRLLQFWNPSYEENEKDGRNRQALRPYFFLGNNLVSLGFVNWNIKGIHEISNLIRFCNKKQVNSVWFLGSELYK